MSVKGRIISIHLIDKIRYYPEYAKEIGLYVNMREKNRKDNEEKKSKED